jgi:hypothetical protein
MWGPVGVPRLDKINACFLCSGWLASPLRLEGACLAQERETTKMKVKKQNGNRNQAIHTCGGFFLIRCMGLA